ncbi:hypothetical protein H5T87_04385 [bacterium]|nr:hypothetical protein [bacterium]
MGEIEEEQILHSLSGLLRLHLWKVVNWIGYEIIHGKYFEAMRDLRFLFEGSIYSVIVEDAIESRIFGKYDQLSDIGLKSDIISLWEKLIEQSACSKGRKKRKEMIKEKVREFFSSESSENIREMSEEEKQNYIEDYIEILSDERLWYSTLKLIKEVIKLFEEEFNIKVSRKKEEEFIGIWKALCDYTHYPGRFLEEIIKDPDYVWMEKFNANLFKKMF